MFSKHFTRSASIGTDGNSYYIGEDGAKQNTLHPDHERLARCIGNDRPHLCLTSGHEFWVDPRVPVSAYPKCGDHDFADKSRLEGKTFPYCKAGLFTIDPNFSVISWSVIGHTLSAAV